MQTQRKQEDRNLKNVPLPRTNKAAIIPLIDNVKAINSSNDMPTWNLFSKDPLTA